ncbi:hypothetical protein BHE90_014181 [Fusarium euwallaceae]|uniref:Uncharacterized protein n=1 Tax=Fusarium euwallaceae TaxID=1147111 RepID=A0A430L6Q0_9HYPO|nr:hypothetical protein BHE90_014181 [Fusarium euwallaceae]
MLRRIRFQEKEKEREDDGMAEIEVGMKLRRPGTWGFRPRWNEYEEVQMKRDIACATAYVADAMEEA